MPDIRNAAWLARGYRPRFRPQTPVSDERSRRPLRTYKSNSVCAARCSSLASSIVPRERQACVTVKPQARVASQTGRKILPGQRKAGAACSPPPPRSSCRASPGTRPRRAPACSRYCSTGCTSTPARSGWVASPAARLGQPAGGWRSRRPRVAVPDSRTSRSSRSLVLIASGTGATIIHMPTIASLWQTSYGKAMLEHGAAARGATLAAVNLLRTKPRLAAAGRDARSVRRRRCAGSSRGESVLVARAVFAAALLSPSRRPPRRWPRVGVASTHVGPGTVTRWSLEERLTVRVPRLPEPGRGSERLRASGQPGGAAGAVPR